MTANVEAYQVRVVEDFLRGACVTVSALPQKTPAAEEIVKAIIGTLRSYLDYPPGIAREIERGRDLR